MFILLVLCSLMATAIALPVDLPDTGVVRVPETELHTNLPQVIAVLEIKKDNNEIIEDDKKKLIILPSLPAPPELPPMDKSIQEYLDKERKDKTLEELKPESEKSQNPQDGEIKEMLVFDSKIPNVNYPGLNVLVKILNV